MRDYPRSMHAESPDHNDNVAAHGPGDAPWERWTARYGFVAEGLVYVLIGGLALVAAFDPRVRPQGASGALDMLARAPLGNVMLVALVGGLVAFAAWKLIQAAFDPEYRHQRHDLRRAARRVGCLFSAVIYGVLACGAGWRLFALHHTRAADSGRAQAQWTQWAMQQPSGRWAVAAVGIGIATFGLFQLRRAVRAGFGERIGPAHIRRRRAIIVIGRIGVFARGAVFALIGVLLVYAAWSHDAKNAHGIAGALNTLEHQAFGPWLLAATATGLIAYGVLQFARARFR